MVRAKNKVKNTWFCLKDVCLALFQMAEQVVYTQSLFYIPFDRDHLLAGEKLKNNMVHKKYMDKFDEFTHVHSVLEYIT
jgi:hypothetical protein